MGIQYRTDRHKFSKLRQALLQLAEEVKQLVKPYYSDNSVIKGSVYELKRKCGKPGCKCAKEQLHPRMVLSASEKGKTQLRVIPQGFFVEVQNKVRRYQELRRARARMVEVHKKILNIMDEMESMRRVEIPKTTSEEKRSRA